MGPWSHVFGRLGVVLRLSSSWSGRDRLTGHSTDRLLVSALPDRSAAFRCPLVGSFDRHGLFDLDDRCLGRSWSRRLLLAGDLADSFSRRLASSTSSQWR